MNEITVGGKGEPRVDSRDLADHLGNQHQNVFELVKNYQPDFEAFGKVRFETGASEGSRTGQKVRFAMLNEDQCYLLLTFSRNTAKVRALKVRLIQAFKEARQSREFDSVEYLPTYHQLHDEIHKLAAGSENERFVHMNVNKAINKAIGIDSGMRNVIGFPAKSLVATAQIVAAKAMEGADDHHDGYENAKAALTQLGAVLAGPKPKKLPNAA